MGGFEFGGEVLRGGGVVGVVDGDVAAFCGEGAGDFGAETSGSLGLTWIFLWRWLGSFERWDSGEIVQERG